jgi:hypothetical protein
MRKGRARGSNTRKNGNLKAASNKIMNSNIINQNIYTKEKKKRFSKSGKLETSVLENNQLDLIYNPNSLKKSKENFEQQMFGDFKNKFFESNLNMIISWEELKSIALAIGNRDWGYVKYILTIICLMLKSYQNISDNNQIKISHNSPEIENVNSVIDKMKKMDISPRNEHNKENDSKKINEETVREQLNSLNNIFKKMKNIEVQMNISNCWSCYNNLCVLHPVRSHLTPTSGFKNINLPNTASANINTPNH